MNNNCWWWLLLKSNNYLSNRSIYYAIIINKCLIVRNVKAFSFSLVSSIWLNVAQQNLHSSQTLLHLWNNICAGVHPWNGGDCGEYLGDLSLGVMTWVTHPKQGSPVAEMLMVWWLLCSFWPFLPLCWCPNYRSSHTQPDPWGLRCLFSSVNLCTFSEFVLLVKFLVNSCHSGGT